MNEEYFEWLLNKVGVSAGGNDYSLLCSILHEMIFYPMLGMDENRWEDGVRYRMDFAMQQDPVHCDLIAEGLDQTLGGCTALELMVSLAERISFEMMGSQYEAGPGKWFEEMIGNLGLDMYTNQELMDNENAYFAIEGIVERMIFRKYQYSGAGGLFPLCYPNEDQRETEIMIQMNNYLNENYDILG